MSILQRMYDISVATWQEWLEQSDDPVKRIDRFLAKTKEELERLERLHQQTASHTLRLKRELAAAQQLVDKREHQAITALQAGQEDTARLALADKAVQEERVEQFAPLVEQNKLLLLELEDQMTALRATYEDTAGKRQFYEARMESMRLQQRMQEGRERIGYGGFSNVEQAVSQFAARLQEEAMQWDCLREVRQKPSYAQTAQAGGMAYGPSGEELRRFEVEQELERLKRRAADVQGGKARE